MSLKMFFPTIISLDFLKFGLNECDNPTVFVCDYFGDFGVDFLGLS